MYKPITQYLFMPACDKLINYIVDTVDFVMVFVCLIS